MVGILHYHDHRKDKAEHALERLLYFPFKERSIKNLYILVYSCLRRSIMGNYELQSHFKKEQNQPEELWKEISQLFFTKGSKPNGKITTSQRAGINFRGG